ncbi:hypothetical protein FOZ63_023058 [Perkinsus olseni]|uniref:Uncharacterized protein n=1 Tax=Perkinsus olseni TaxID=32597 RepID=A0A7J6UM29_PEROL|nr:hypothetical protein FOZ63_023058 [Perkinsus olseni]
MSFWNLERALQACPNPARPNQGVVRAVQQLRCISTNEEFASSVVAEAFSRIATALSASLPLVSLKTVIQACIERPSKLQDGVLVALATHALPRLDKEDLVVVAADAEMVDRTLNAPILGAVVRELRRDGSKKLQSGLTCEEAAAEIVKEISNGPWDADLTKAIINSGGFLSSASEDGIIEKLVDSVYQHESIDLAVKVAENTALTTRIWWAFVERLVERYRSADKTTDLLSFVTKSKAVVIRQPRAVGARRLVDCQAEVSDEKLSSLVVVLPAETLPRIAVRPAGTTNQQCRCTTVVERMQQILEGPGGDNLKARYTTAIAQLAAHGLPCDHWRTLVAENCALAQVVGLSDEVSLARAQGGYFCEGLEGPLMAELNLEVDLETAGQEWLVDIPPILPCRDLHDAECSLVELLAVYDAHKLWFARRCMVAASIAASSELAKGTLIAATTKKSPAGEAFEICVRLDVDYSTVVVELLAASFESESEDALCHNGYVRKTGRGEGDFVRTFTKDPVKSLDVTSLKKNLKEFHAGVLAGSKHLNRYSDSHPRDKSIDGERLKEMGKKGASAVKELNNLCSALREVLLNEYHSFANVCEVHRQTAEHVKKGSWVLLQ